MPETVKLHVTVSINVSDPDVDTGLTVDEWNALSNEGRQAIVQEAWEIAAQTDDGGIHVVTEGANGV